MTRRGWTIVQPGGSRRVVVTKELPGERWLQLLTESDCRVEVADGTDVFDDGELCALIGRRCDAVIGQLTEGWTADVIDALAAAGGSILSQYAVGYDNVDVDTATRGGVAVGTTPGVLTETTAELAVALTLATARRLPEGDRIMRSGSFRGQYPTMLLGDQLWRGTLGLVGAGRIGAAYARMMVLGHQMDLVYHNPHANPHLESYVADYAAFLEAHGERAVSCRRCATLAELLAAADVVSLHVPLLPATRHLVGAAELATMKEQAVLINAGRGPLIDEAALVAHCREHPQFRAGLDVYEDEPRMTPGLAELDNVVLSPHLGSATTVTRERMAELAARNVVGVLGGWPVWPGISDIEDVELLLAADGPHATPSIVNAGALGLEVWRG